MDISRRAVLAALGAMASPFAARAQAPDLEPSFREKIVAGARTRIGVTTLYDPAYVSLSYPMGDVANDRGVCTDVVIRALRHAGIDLQAEVHTDMRANFAVYPSIWGLKRPDRNIDHRRVPNLETFFKRKGAGVSVTRAAADYEPGDIVTWRLTGSGLPHCGIVSDREANGERFIIHNIGAGTCEEAVLFSWPVSAHFRFVSWT